MQGKVTPSNFVVSPRFPLPEPDFIDESLLDSFQLDHRQDSPNIDQVFSIFGPKGINICMSDMNTDKKSSVVDFMMKMLIINIFFEILRWTEWIGSENRNWWWKYENTAALSGIVCIS